MDWQGWFTLAIVFLVICGMVSEYGGPDFVIGAGLCSLAAAGILSPRETFSGFANPSLAAIGALYVVSAGLRETGLIDRCVDKFLFSERPTRSILRVLCLPLALMSAFLNNAPIVASVTPVIRDWTRRRGLAASHFLMPISHATILGGSTTLIGTSVNLTVAGLIISSGLEPMGLFELAPVGLALVGGGTCYLIFAAEKLLPERQHPGEYLGEHRREYLTAMRVGDNCILTGKTIQDGGLRQLSNLFLVEIDREGKTLTPVGPDELIQAGDELIFAGAVSTIVDLQRIPGLQPSTVDENMAEAHGLMEAVISESSPLIHQTIKEARFRTVYDAAVVGVHRNGERLAGKIGSIVLHPGDTLLLQAGRDFLETHRNNPDFYLINPIEITERSERKGKSGFAFFCLAGMVGVIALNLAHAAIAALLAAGTMLFARCLTGRQARQAIDWPVLVIIGSGGGLALGMEKTGAAFWIAEGIVGTAGTFGPVASLIAIYLATMLLAELLHHAAAAALMVPVALATATSIGAEPRTFAITVAIAATCSFMNPTTYHTHLMVYGPGGYRFSDFVRFGAPLNLLCALIALLIVPYIWGF